MRYKLQVSEEQVVWAKAKQTGWKGVLYLMALKTILLPSMLRVMVLPS